MGGLRTVTLAWLAVTAPLASQSPGLRAELAGYQADLARVGDTTALRARERALEPGTDSSDTGTIPWLHRGLTRIRLGQVGDGWSFGRATRDFSAAAAQLHLTQPAVSKRIALLEASLGARLFDRLGR